MGTGILKEKFRNEIKNYKGKWYNNIITNSLEVYELLKQCFYLVSKKALVDREVLQIPHLLQRRSVPPELKFLHHLLLRHGMI